VAAGREIEISVEVLLRISAVLGIQKALTTRFDEEGKLTWLYEPHDAPWLDGPKAS